MWLDGDDSDEEAAVDVTAQSSAAEEDPLPDSAEAVSVSKIRTAADHDPLQADHETEPSSSSRDEGNTGLPWGGSGQPRPRQQVLVASQVMSQPVAVILRYLSVLCM